MTDYIVVLSVNVSLLLEIRLKFSKSPIIKKKTTKRLFNAKKEFVFALRSLV